MRKENDIQEFDLQIRSLLQDAEEKVPARVWKSVSERMGHGRSAFTPVWKWAGASFAFAAALAAALVFTGTFDRTSSPALQPDEVYARAESGTVPESLEEITHTDISGIAEEPQILARARARSGIMTATPASEAAASGGIRQTLAETVPVNGTDAVAGKAEPSPASAAATEGNASGSEDTAAGDTPGSWAEFLAQQPSGTRRGAKRRGASFLAHGLIGGNNVSPRSVHTWQGVRGAGPNGINELGNTNNFSIPFTVGVGVNFALNDRISIGTGLDYSLLTRSFYGTYSGDSWLGVPLSADIFHSIQYLGIPLNLYYGLLNFNTVSLYAFAGGTAEYAVSNKYKVYLSEDRVLTVNDPVNKFQFSAGAGIGLEFLVTDSFGIFIDPSVRYYFYTNGQPKSIRTEKPLMFNLKAGIKFNL